MLGLCCEGVAVIDGEAHAAIVRVSFGVTGHVVALDVCLDNDVSFDVHRPLLALGTRPLLRGDAFDARAVDDNERSFELLAKEGVVGTLRLGQRVLLDDERRESRIARVLHPAKAAA